MAEKEREIKFEIVKHVGILAEGRQGWMKEVNLVSWNGRAPKIDIREWDQEHVKMGKGITLNAEETSLLRDLLSDVDQVFETQEKKPKISRKK